MYFDSLKKNGMLIHAQCVAIVVVPVNIHSFNHLFHFGKHLSILHMQHSDE